MANKVRYGLANTKYALYDSTTGGYGDVKDFPGAVSLSLSREGSDATDFYADDGIWYSVPQTNGGYSSDLEMAHITDAVRQDLLGEVVDDDGVQLEYAGIEMPEFALITQMQGDEGPVGFVFYGCKASRIETSANTKGESVEVDTDTISMRISGRDYEFDGATRHFIQGHIDKTADNATKYAEFFTSVHVPTKATE